MAFLSTQATRTAVIVIALSGASLWALSAMGAKADPPPLEDAQQCVEGRSLFAAKLAYLEARISPEPGQEAAWRTFADATRVSTGELDRACLEEPHGPLSVDAGERPERMEKHAAATQTMFSEMANAYEAVASNVTSEQHELLWRDTVLPQTDWKRIPEGRSRRYLGNTLQTAVTGDRSWIIWRLRHSDL